MTEKDKHDFDLIKIQEKVKDFYSKKQSFKIYHGSTNSTRSQKFERGKYVDVSNLNRIIEVNVTERYALVEPNVHMDQLIEATIKKGLVPPVVMEFPGITVGGGIQGGAGESSSFKYGLFNETCLEYELILGNGEIIKTSPTKNSDLFHGTAGSYGTLGVITLIKLSLIPTQLFVHLKYERVSNFDEAIKIASEKTSENVDFVDAIIFEKNRGVVMLGNFTDKKNLPVSSFSKASDEWFYIHADNISKTHVFYEEIIPLKEYLFRYDRGAFWMGKYGFDFLKVPFNRLTRFIFNSSCTTRKLYQSLHAANFSQQYLIQDISLPKNSAVDFLNYVTNTLNIYPLWFIPIKPTTKEKLSLNYLQTELIISVGIWADINQDYFNFVEINKNLERVVTNLGGRKWLYAHQYYSPKEFWEMYDHYNYNLLRKKYHATSTFPDLYEKTKVSEKYKTSIWQAIWKNIFKSLKLPIS